MMRLEAGDLGDVHFSWRDCVEAFLSRVEGVVERSLVPFKVVLGTRPIAGLSGTFFRVGDA